MEKRRVVVTGLGTINPLGNNIKDYFDNLNKGVCGATLVDRFDTSHFKTKFACQVSDFKSSDFGIDRKEERRLDRFSKFALAATIEAVRDSEINLETENLDRIGVVLGSGIGGLESLYEEIVDYSEGGKIPRFSPFLITKMISDIAPGIVSIKFGFAGPNYTTTSACASAAHAMADSLMLIRNDKADIIVTGGSEAPITVPSIGGFNAIQALSTNNENYLTASRPFDKTRDGFVMGEGAGILIFEELEHAKARGAKIYAEICGAGMTADAHHITAPHPDGHGAIRVMEIALEDAGISPQEVDYVNVHGTSTPLGDVAELRGVKQVFGEHAYKLSISATKSMHGHLLGASAAVEALACINAINSGIIPPTINFQEPDPEIDYNLNLTLNKSQEREVDVAIKNTFGFGGHNSCLVFRKYK